MIVSYIEPILAAYARMIAEGAASGEFQPINHRHFYFIVIGASDQIFASREVLRHIHGIGEVTDELRRSYSEQAIATIIVGLAVRPRTTRCSMRTEAPVN